VALYGFVMPVDWLWTVALDLFNSRAIKCMHWKATMEYNKTKDILHVMKLLGHKSINSTLLYTQLISFEGDEFNVKVGETKKEITALLEAGFEWVGRDGDGLTYFRKRK
jgi:hypothetical protein